MEVDIKLFATLKDRAGGERIRVTLPDEGADVRTLLAAVGAAYPALAPALGSALVAVNRAFAVPDTVVGEGDEVALFPPVSGGDQPAGSRPEDGLPYPTYFAVTAEALDADAIHARLVDPEVGAIVTFTGYVRGMTRRDGLPPETLHLEYEAYQEMAELKMAQIAREIWARWPMVRGVALVQRLGRLDIGQVTTFVACAGPHRDQGVFEAARYGIDRLKEIVPVWKKEVGRDRSVWVEGHYHPTDADNLPDVEQSDE
jgi:molybdopterin synthase catalytic subunit